MNTKERELFMCFVYNQRCFMEEDISTIQNNLLNSRRISYVDYLELVLAQNKLDNFEEFVNNVYGLLDVSNYKMKLKKNKRL